MSRELPTEDLLPDIIDKRVNLLFVSPAPLHSWVESGHYHNGNGDRFYELLRDAGLTADRVVPSADITLPDHEIGLTTLAKTRSVQYAEELKPVDFSIGRLIRLVFEYSPKIVCCEGRQVFRDFFDRQGEFGLQKEKIADATVFIAPPSTDDQMVYTKLLEYYRQLQTP